MSTTTDTSTDQKVKLLPQFKVILHDDDVNEGPVVAKKVQEFTSLGELESLNRTIEAHEEGMSLLLVCHQERAELIQDQFQSCVPPIKVTIERE